MESNTATIEVPVLQKLVSQLEYQNTVKQDIVVPGYTMHFDGMSELLNISNHEYRLTEHCHDQISQKLEIPIGYYRKLRKEFPDLLASNINGWLSKKESAKYLLRTFNYDEAGTQNICRAMLSNRYNVMDNFDVLIAALDAIKKAQIHVEIVKAEVTEKRMYLHVIAPEIHVQATELLDGYLADRSNAILNNGIISGIVISNSEVGLGTYEVSARAQVLRCKNGVHDRDAKFRKVHLGARLDEGIIDWSEGTKQKNYELIVSQTRDAVKTYLSEEYLGKLTTKLQSYKEQTVEHPSGLIERVSTELNIAESHKESILRYFLKDNDESVFGMFNAFTRESQNMSADKQYDVESNVFQLLPQMHKWDKPVSKN